MLDMCQVTEGDRAHPHSHDHQMLQQNAGNTTENVSKNSHLHLGGQYCSRSKGSPSVLRYRLGKKMSVAKHCTGAGRKLLRQ